MKDSFLEYYPAARRGFIWQWLLLGLAVLFPPAYLISSYHLDGWAWFTPMLSTFIMAVLIFVHVFFPNFWLRFFFPIVGLDNVLTVVGDKVLKPGEVLRRWSYPNFVHTVPLEGAEYLNWTLNLSGANQLHNLELLVPAYRPDVGGEWSIKFFGEVQYSINPDRFNQNVLRQEDPSSLRAQLYQAIVYNRLKEKLRETCVDQLHEMLEKYCDSLPIKADYELSAALLKYVNEHWATDSVCLKRNYPLFLSLERLQMELVYRPPEERTVI